MDRETKSMQVAQHQLVVKTYATAREHQAIQSTLFAGAKFDVAGQEPKLSDFSPAVMFTMHEEMVRQMVVSMDGSPDDIVNRCLDLPSDEFDELIAELDALVSKKKK